jgi:hypothetical protein
MRGDSTAVEDFVAVTTGESVIAIARQELLLPDTLRTYHIHGDVTHGNGGHNLDWEWHFIPSDWFLAQESIEICDTSPSAISSLLANLPDTQKTILACPLSSYVKAEIE